MCPSRASEHKIALLHKNPQKRSRGRRCMTMKHPVRALSWGAVVATAGCVTCRPGS